jgi:hypothetical protein
VFYEDLNFGKSDTNSNGSVLWVWGQDFKFNLRGEMEKSISSLRFIGPSNDYFADSLTFFTDDHLKGEEYYLYTDFPTFPGFEAPIRSAATTGSSPWMLFE